MKVSKGHKKTAKLLLYLVVLFFLYALRAPDDLFDTFLWAEDGKYLISDAMFEGPACLFRPVPGYMWVLQRIISQLSYWFCLLIDRLGFIPLLQGIITKLIAVSSIAYFLSDRFEWLVKEPAWRFFVCACVIMSIPYFGYEILTSDIAVFFVMDFEVFLIGLDTMLGKDPRPITVIETVFLSLLALSTPASPFCRLVAVLAVGRFLYVSGIKKNAEKKVVYGIIRTAVVLMCALSQLFVTLSGRRVSSDLSLLSRLKECCRCFVFFPYSNSFDNIYIWAAALIGFVALFILSKIDRKTFIYSVLYSFFMLFYCSMAGSPGFVLNEMSKHIGCRYYLMGNMIAFFLLGIEICLLWKQNVIRKCISAVLCTALLVLSVRTYEVEMHGAEYSNLYKEYISFFERNGSDRLYFNIGPWMPWFMGIPCDISEEVTAVEGISCNVETVGGDKSGVVNYIIVEGNLNRSFEYIFVDAGEGVYIAPVTHNDGFRFCISDEYYNDNVLHFIGITEDHESYNWDVLLNE